MQCIEESKNLLYEAVSCCEDPVLMNKSTTTGVEECWFWTTCRPNLTQILDIKDDTESVIEIKQRRMNLLSFQHFYFSNCGIYTLNSDVHSVVSHLHGDLPGPGVWPGRLSVHDARRNSRRNGWSPTRTGPFWKRKGNPSNLFCVCIM